MKKTVCALLAASMVLTSFPNVCFADTDISVTVDGRTIAFDVKPQIINGRTMVPMRAIFEELGAEIEWLADTKTVYGKRTDTLISLQADSSEMHVSNALGESIIELEAPATIIDKRTLVPARAVAEGFDCSVEWNADTKTVIITTKNFSEVEPELPEEEPEQIEEENEQVEKDEYIYKMTDKDIKRTIITGAADPELFVFSYTNIYSFGITKTRNDISNDLGKCSAARVVTPKYEIARLSQKKLDKDTNATSATLKEGKEIYEKFAAGKQLCVEFDLAYPVSSNAPGIEIKAYQGDTEIISPVTGSPKYDSSKEFPYIYTATITISQNNIDVNEDVKIEVIYINENDFADKKYEKYPENDFKDMRLYYTVNFSKYQ